MYSAPYGYPNPNAGGQGFNGAPPQPNHMQPGPQGQPQMMYTPQQFPMGAQGGFPGAPNMMPGAGPAGMMQNAGMPHMPNGQMGYQTPYTSSPYGAGIPSAGTPQPQMQPGFGMMAGQMPGYPMGAGSMAQQQQMMQRMQQQQSPQNAAAMGTPTPQRTMNVAQGTPVNPMQHMAPQSQTPNNVQQTTPVVSTPQTPTFPTGPGAAINGSAAPSAPLSPGSEKREKEICNTLLEINQELFFEIFHLQTSQQELKKMFAAQPADEATNEQRKKQLESMTADFNQCMRRINSNLSSLSFLVGSKSLGMKDPQYLKAPPLDMSIKLRSLPAVAVPDGAKLDPTTEREERYKSMQELYAKLQKLYPGVDPNKEPAFPLQAPNPATTQAQKTPHLANAPPPAQPQPAAPQ